MKIENSRVHQKWEKGQATHQENVKHTRYLQRNSESTHEIYMYTNQTSSFKCLVSAVHRVTFSSLATHTSVPEIVHEISHVTVQPSLQSPHRIHKLLRFILVNCEVPKSV